MDFEYCVRCCITVVNAIAEDKDAPDRERARLMLESIEQLSLLTYDLGLYDEHVIKQIEYVVNFEVSDTRLYMVQRSLLNFKKNKPVIRDYKTCADICLVGVNM